MFIYQDNLPFSLIFLSKTKIFLYRDKQKLYSKYIHSATKKIREFECRTDLLSLTAMSQCIHVQSEYFKGN